MDQSTREHERSGWISRHWEGSYELEPASADASFRSYWRVTGKAGSKILMDAPPDKEDSRPFVTVNKMLHCAGVHVPEIFFADLESGFLLIEDLGTTLYGNVLRDDTADSLYGDALDTLAIIQRIDPDPLPPYDQPLLHREMDLFPDWLLKRHLRRSFSDHEAIQWELLKRTLTDNAFAQPKVFVHRDYHCRNLMVCPGDNPGVLDFQDAVRGPVTYDLVSLLRDCYVRWPTGMVDNWSEDYRHRHAPEIDRDIWRRWFDLTGFQRHLKAAGIFCRLFHRDGKSGYLQDIPRTLGYVQLVCQRYPEFRWFDELLSELLTALKKS